MISPEERKRILEQLFQALRSAKIFDDMTPVDMKQAAIQSEQRAFSESKSYIEYIHAMKNMFYRIEAASQKKYTQPNFFAACKSAPGLAYPSYASPANYKFSNSDDLNRVRRPDFGGQTDSLVHKHNSSRLVPPNEGLFVKTNDMYAQKNYNQNMRDVVGSYRVDTQSPKQPCRPCPHPNQASTSHYSPPGVSQSLRQSCAIQNNNVAYSQGSYPTYFCENRKTFDYKKPYEAIITTKVYPKATKQRERPFSENPVFFNQQTDKDKFCIRKETQTPLSSKGFEKFNYCRGNQNNLHRDNVNKTVAYRNAINRHNEPFNSTDVYDRNNDHVYNGAKKLTVDNQRIYNVSGAQNRFNGGFQNFFAKNPYDQNQLLPDDCGFYKNSEFLGNAYGQPQNKNSKPVPSSMIGKPTHERRYPADQQNNRDAGLANAPNWHSYNNYHGQQSDHSSEPKILSQFTDKDDFRRSLNRKKCNQNFGESHHFVQPGKYVYENNVHNTAFSVENNKAHKNSPSLHSYVKGCPEMQNINYNGNNVVGPTRDAYIFPTPAFGTKLPSSDSRTCCYNEKINKAETVDEKNDLLLFENIKKNLFINSDDGRNEKHTSKSDMLNKEYGSTERPIFGDLGRNTYQPHFYTPNKGSAKPANEDADSKSFNSSYKSVSVGYSPKIAQSDHYEAQAHSETSYVTNPATFETAISTMHDEKPGNGTMCMSAILAHDGSKINAPKDIQQQSLTNVKLHVKKSTNPASANTDDIEAAQKRNIYNVKLDLMKSEIHNYLASSGQKLVSLNDAELARYSVLLNEAKDVLQCSSKIYADYSSMYKTTLVTSFDSLKTLVEKQCLYSQYNAYFLSINFLSHLIDQLRSLTIDMGFEISQNTECKVGWAEKLKILFNGYKERKQRNVEYLLDLSCNWL